MNERYRIYNDRLYVIEIDGKEYEFFGEEISQVVALDLICRHDYVDLSHIPCDCGIYHNYCQDCDEQLDDCESV
jgi:hypothetical protein